MLIVAVPEVVPINFAFALFTVADKHQNKKNGPKHAKTYQIVACEVQGLCHYYLTSRKQNLFWCSCLYPQHLICVLLRLYHN